MKNKEKHEDDMEFEIINPYYNSENKDYHDAINNMCCDRSISPNAFVHFHRLNNLKNSEITITALAKTFEISRSTFYRRLNELIKSGYVTRENGNIELHLIPIINDKV